MKYFILLSFLCLSSITSANEVLNEFFNNLKTLHSKFDQKLLDEGGNLLETSEGEVYLQRPAKFRWHYQNPYEQLIVGDGEKVWIYDLDLEQVTVKSMNEALGKTPAWLLTSGKNVENDFFVTKLSAQAGVTAWILKPKDKEAQFNSMGLSLKSDEIQHFELKDNLGQTTIITFKHSRYNQTLDREFFTFTPPKNVDILEDIE